MDNDPNGGRHHPITTTPLPLSVGLPMIKGVVWEFTNHSKRHVHCASRRVSKREVLIHPTCGGVVLFKLGGARRP